MATKDNTHYWRLYLYLNKGVSLLSKDQIVRELDEGGQKLSCLLRKNEGNIRQKMRLNATDLNVLFPADGETDMKQWSANLYLCVLQALFRASIKPNKKTERTKLGVIQTIFQDLLDMQDDTTLDNVSFEEYVQNLEEAFLVLTSNEDSTMKMVEMKKFYIDQPLDSSGFLRETAELYIPSGLKENLAEFLKQITSTNTVRSDEIGECENSKGGTQKHKMHDSENQTEDAVVNNSIQDNNADFGRDEIDAVAINGDQENRSDEIGACATNEDSENSSDGIGTVVTAADVENEIVSNAIKPQTDEEIQFVARQLDMTLFEQYVRQHDLETFISQELNTWKNQHINIAVIGRTGVGKSRLINAIRGWKEGDPEYAQIDMTEAKMSVEKYPDPKNSLVVYWELPGIGTDNFPRDKYTKMKEINFFAYDLYLIVCADRFTEDDDYLVKTLEESGKTFLFVQTKADVNEEEFQDFKSVLERMRTNCVENRRSRKIQAKDIYLISSKKVDHKLLEFDRLVERLVNFLPDLKKEAVLTSLRFNTKTLIKEKRTQLISRAKKVSTASAAVGSMPIPGLPFYVNYKLILNELGVYRDTLFINESNLQDLADQIGMDVNELKSKYKLKSFDLFKDRALGATQCLALVLENIAKLEVARITAQIIPIVGITIGAGISGCVTYKFLTSMLEILVQDAETMLNILLEKPGSSIF